MEITGGEVQAYMVDDDSTSQSNSCGRCLDHRAVCGHRPGTADDVFRSALFSVHPNTLSLMHFTFGGCCNKSLHLQPLQRCYCGNSGSTASACVMRRHYPITYTQSLHAINGFIAVGRVGNLFCGRPSWLRYGNLQNVENSYSKIVKYFM